MWVTELHLSFCRKVTIPSDHEEIILEGPEKSSAFPGEPKPSLKRLQKGAIGWRFSGDLHDRRWTGTILASVPGRNGDVNRVTSHNFEIEMRFHGQRKIIETRIFSDMIETIYLSTREILRDLNTVLNEGEGGIYRGPTDYHNPFSKSFDQSNSRSKLFL